MAERVRFYTDEHISKAVVAGLRRRGIDVVRAQEVGLRKADDSAHLEFARRGGRVLVTQDAGFIQRHEQGVEHPGLAFCQQGSRSIGEIIAGLILIYEVLTPEEMRGRVEYL